MKALTLSAVNIPIYVIKSLGHCHLVIAGGGGSAKTGINNKIIIYEIVATKKACQLNQVQEILLESDAIMTGALMSSLNYDEKDISSGSLFATAGSPTNMLRLYNIRFTFPDPFKMDIHASLERVAIDDTTLENDGYKCLVSGQGGCTLMGGGMNGSVTIWPNMNNLKSFTKFQALSGEIDEIDVHPDGVQVMILSRKKGCFVWDVWKGKKLHELSKTSVNSDANSVTYEFRSCKFSPTINKKDSTACLYTVSNPPNCVKAASKLLKWETQQYKIVKQIHVGFDAIMALAISKDDRFIGLGTAVGSVYIHNSSNLQQIYNVKKAHNIFVTSLEFLPPTPESKLLTNTDTCSLVSVSVDQKIVLHRPTQSSLRYGIISRILIFLLIYMIYEALSYYLSLQQ